MSDAFQIIPECYVDTTLVSTLLGGIGVNHQKGCNNVVSKMRNKFKDSFAVGIIDNDKRRPGYLDEFVLVSGSEHLALYKHTSMHHFIITISPAAEVFILDSAKETGLSMPDFGLPSDLNGLKKITKRIVSSKNDSLTRLFSSLRSFGEVALLTGVLEYLLENKYSASVEELTGIFRDRIEQE